MPQQILQLSRDDLKRLEQGEPFTVTVGGQSVILIAERGLQWKGSVPEKGGTWHRERCPTCGFNVKITSPESWHIHNIIWCKRIQARGRKAPKKE